MNQEIKNKVEEALESIRPFLKTDGGDVELVGIDESMKVTLRLMGACSSCEMSGMTMKAGIEQAIKRFVPQITEVVSVS